MTSSPKREDGAVKRENGERKGDAAARKAGDELPPALRSMWRLCKLGYRHEPRLMFSAFVLSQLAALPDALTRA